MNCAQVRDQLALYLDETLALPEQTAVTQHLAECAACRSEAAEFRHLEQRLRASAGRFAENSVATAVMQQIAGQEPATLGRKTMSRYSTKAGLIAAAAIIAVCFFVPWGGSRHGQATAAEVMAQAAQAAANLRAVFIKVSIRGLPRDNFETLDLDGALLPVRLWKHFGAPPQWRAEKPGRTVVMDGQAGVGLIGDDSLPSAAQRPPQGYRFAFAPTPPVWVGGLLDVEDLLDQELHRAQRMHWGLNLAQQAGSDGTPKLVVTVEAKAQGDFANDWCKNRSVYESDTRRVYRFDAHTKRLENLQLWVHRGQEDILVLQTDEVVYDPDLAPDLFTLQAPPNTIWSLEPEAVTDHDQHAQTPAEAARAFFQACADRNWEEARKFLAVSELEPAVKTMFGGLQIVTVGEAFQSGSYPGWFVPYEIKLMTGQTRKFNLAVRNDNPAGRFVVDGGF
jgi:hypothetical protein